MKLILSSQGFTTDEIAQAVQKLVGKPLQNINIAIINEAYVAKPETSCKRWMIKELARIEKYIGGVIDFVNLRAYDKTEIKRRLQNADMMYIVGGKNFILPDLFQETEFDDVLKEFAKEKVIMGTSAGAIVLGKQIQSDAYWQARYNVTNQEIKTKTLGLVDFNIVPHYKREDHKQWDRDFLKRTLSDNSFNVYAVTDEQAVIYENGKISFVGGEVEVFGKKFH